MADGRRKETWWHTASVLSMLANCNRDSKKKSEPFTPADFHPLIKKVEPEPIRVPAPDLIVKIGQSLKSQNHG